MVFIDANDGTLLKRFSERRRRHPLTSEGLSLAEAIEKEKLRLEPVSRYAQLMIDTTSKTPHELCEVVVERVLGNKTSRLSLLFESFGFKNGAPNDADFVFDARCLPNPYWDESLRALDGTDSRVQTYVQNDPRFAAFFQKVLELTLLLLPAYQDEGKKHLAIAFGCTGGQHRSVTLAEILSKALAEHNWPVSIRHRELERRQSGI